jgi:hypothetical protein
MRTIVLLSAGLLALAAAPAAALEVQLGAEPGARLELELDLQNLMLLRNDVDFDDSKPEYDSQGQSIGLLGTFFRPRIGLWADADFGVCYEVELGLNLWSQHDPEQALPGQPEAFPIRHRELWAAGAIAAADLDFKLGYQYLRDPAGLLLGHWIGALDLGWHLDGLRLGLQLGQIPDQNHEGIAYERNNFVHDVFFAGLRADWPFRALGLDWTLRGGLFAVYDGAEVEHERKLLSPVLRLELDAAAVRAGLDLALQLGELQRDALGDRDARLLAWALQADLAWRPAPWLLELHLLWLSPDDAHDHNDFEGAFVYSGKSRSRTLILTEDELRDLGRNLDERLGERRAAWNRLRAGLVVADVYAGWDLGWFQPGLVVGAGLAPQPKNAMDSAFVGLECDLDLAFRYRDRLEVHLVGGLLLPGTAAGAALNAIDPGATDPWWQVELSVLLRL